VQEFIGRFSISLLLRFGFSFISVTDLYQDAGTAINLAACESKDIETPGLWKFTPEGFLLNRGSDWLQVNKCISAVEPGSHDPTSLSLEVCEFQTAQHWDLRNNQLRSTLGSQKCVALGTDDSLQMQKCDKSSVQQWRFSGGFIKSYKGECLTSQTADLALKPCDGIEERCDGLPAVEEP